MIRVLLPASEPQRAPASPVGELPEGAARLLLAFVSHDVERENGPVGDKKDGGVERAASVEQGGRETRDMAQGPLCFTWLFPF